MAVALSSRPFADYDLPAPNEPPLIKVRGLNHWFGEGENKKQALYDNNLEITPGEIVIMTGPSGSGKTTLLTLVGGLRTVQDGELEVLGTSMRGLATDRLVEIRRNIGFIFQAHNLFASLTATQNVCMGLQLHGWNPAQMQERSLEILTQLGLGHRLHYKPENLSGGQRQRVAIGRALAHKPRLVLADEPTAALDAKSSQDVVDLLYRLSRELKASILLVTHDNRILNVADRLVNMVDGRIVSNVLVNVTLKICTFLKKVELFAGLAPDALTKLAEKMGMARFTKGDKIIVQGDQGDKFYLLRRGIVDVVVGEGTSDRKVVNTLSEGDHFGEIALLTGGKRTATIEATSDDVETWTLDKPNFESAIAASDTFKDQIHKVLFQRQ
ncbi:MAG: ATP-binding cassette domain-containing protein [Gemmataceae bacterium]|nr:ATP-binding cassette domain-containing protein [Gemmataceae bacterium]